MNGQPAPRQLFGERADTSSMTSSHDPAANSEERRRFILNIGVFGWGITTALQWSVAMAWLGPPGPFGVYLAMALVLFPIGGWFWGAIMWRMTQQHRSTPSMSNDT